METMPDYLEARDTQAQLLYACEKMTPYAHKSPTFKTIEDARYRLRLIQCSRVWAEKIQIAGYVHLAFDVSEQFAGMFSWDAGKHPTITLYQHGMNDSVLMHELAHYIVSQWWGYKYPAHGNHYANTYLGLMQHFVGVEETKILMGWFDHAGVKYTI